MRTLRFFILSCIMSMAFTAAAGEPSGEPSDPHTAMNALRLDAMIKRLDPDANGQPGNWRFRIQNTMVLVIADESADRMRIISPIAESESLDKELMYRLMQANFDTTLDARYAVAKGYLWSAYIHPLSPLDDETFLTAVGQVVNSVKSFGTSFSSGLMLFRGGDSEEELEQRRLLEELKRKGMPT